MKLTKSILSIAFKAIMFVADPIVVEHQGLHVRVKEVATAWLRPTKENLVYMVLKRIMCVKVSGTIQFRLL
jgi:hypothetical protein